MGNVILKAALGLALAAGALCLVPSLGGLEKQARANAARALALPPARYLAPDTADGWTALPPAAPGSVITAADFAALPEPARRYFAHAGVAGRRRISSFAVVMEGRIRNAPDAAWMPLVMRQFNRLDNPARVVYLTSTKPPMNGIDSFLDGSGRMLIKAMNLIKVVDSRGPEMAVSAFVTFLNDLVLCPLAYFSLPIRWRQAGPNGVELSLTHAGMTVTAVLTVDQDGRPADWRSNDRFAEVKGKNLKDKWSTPFSGSIELAGLRIPERGSGIHDYDGRPYVYVELERIYSLTLNAKGLPERP